MEGTGGGWGMILWQLFSNLWDLNGPLRQAESPHLRPIQRHAARIGVNAMAGQTSRKSTTVAKKAVANGDGAKPVLLSGGNPQIAKADGDAPVQAYIAAMPGWKSDVGRRLDDLIVRNVRKAVRWNSPWYGVEGEGWFVSYHVFTRYVKVTFLNGASLRPVPPGSGKDPDSRWLDIYEGELDETQMATWVRQAAALPGWRGF